MTHENYKELLAANALTALDATDARALRIHLESCADCRSEMSAWEHAAALLAFDAKPLEPSAQVREQILASVRAPTAGDKAKVIAFARPQRDVWVSLGSFGAIAATVVFMALIISLIVLWQQNRTNQQELARLSKEMKQAQARLDREHAMGQLLTSPDAHMAKLAGTKVAPGAHAMLAYDKNGHAMLMAKGLPAAPEGMAYQLWFIVGDRPMPGKVFKTEASGDGMLEDDVPAEAMNAAVFAITLEPENGVKAPTGAMYLRGSS